MLGFKGVLPIDRILTFVASISVKSLYSITCPSTWTNEFSVNEPKSPKLKVAP